jgi:two-component system LytT family response regulator
MPILSKINCLIVDDEPPARKIIGSYIGRIPQLHLVTECNNAIDAFTVLQGSVIDLIFLDIEMPQLKGTNFLKSLPSPPKTIITSAYTEYALEGYDLNIVDYLVKPIEFDRFVKAINKVFPYPEREVAKEEAVAKKEKERPFFYFRADRKMVKVFLSDILYIEGLKEYVRVVTKNSSLITKTSIVSLESMLPQDKFLRIHRSFIVSLDAINSFTSEIIEIGKAELPIGKVYRENVLHILNN